MRNQIALLILKRRKTLKKLWVAGNSGLFYFTKARNMGGKMQTSIIGLKAKDLQSLSLKLKIITSVSEGSLVLSGHHLNKSPS